MVRQVVRPLTISKGTPTSSPNKPRPLAEVGSNEHRRNSPSYNQATRKAITSADFDPSPQTDSSPFMKDVSPRAFFHGRDPMSPSRYDAENVPEQRESSPGLLSPKRRASIERLKQAGRVKTSNIFAMESRDAYNPDNVPVVERPSANRPKSQGLLNNTFTRFDSQRKENNPLSSPLSSPRPGHKRSESQNALQMSSPAWDTRTNEASTTSPTKSALSRSSQFGSPLERDQIHQWSEGEDRAPTPRARVLHRHNKSVTFHEDPQVNEYENPTPEPSVSATSESREGSWDSDEHYEDYSFERGSSLDQHRDDSFDEDLENADKTPVVLPEDWSRMSPEAARKDLVDEGDDVFEGSPSPQRPILGRSESVASDGESRPLPPLPGLIRRRDSDALFAAAERAANAARTLPSPPKRASCTKDDIIKMRNGRPSPGHPEVEHRGAAEELVVKNLDTGEVKDVSVNVDETDVGEDSVVAELAEFANSPPKISRESILRKLRNSKYETDEDDVDASVTNCRDSPERPTYEELARMHPDEPIPSRENSRETSAKYFGGYDDASEVQIKEEPMEDSQFDMASVPAVEQFQALAPTPAEDYDRDSSVLRHNIRSPSEDRSPSRDSSVGPDAESTNLDLHASHMPTIEADDGKESLHDAMQLLTVKDYSIPAKKSLSTSGEFELPTYLSTDDFDFGIKDFLTPPPTSSSNNIKANDVISKAPFLAPAAEIKPSYKDLPRPTYDGADYSPEGTPESVVHHSTTEEISGLEDHSQYLQETQPPPEMPEIPERTATIRTGGQLKARASATPADMRMMAEQRRLVSAEHPVPPIPQAYAAQMEETTEMEEDAEVTTYSSGSNESKADSGVEAGEDMTNTKLKKMSINLDIPSVDGDEGLDFEQAFDRVIETQKVRQSFHLLKPFTSIGLAFQKTASEQEAFTAEGQVRTPGFVPDAPTPFSPQNTDLIPRTQKGYLMRQNTKLVVASNRNFSGDSNGTAKSNESGPTSASQPNSAKNSKGSPRKPSAEQFLQTEPWNGKARRKSQRQASAQQIGGAAPPLPGQPSALGVVDEDFAAGTSSLEDDVGEGVERGRLFVKVVGVKNLDLPMPKNDRLYFQLTLDNGLHCVTTASLELGKTAPIGQEFELVVLNDLEFQLTLSTKLPPPPKTEAPLRPLSPTKTPKHTKSSSISRFLSSPKKRAAEKERAEREAADAEERRRAEEEAFLKQQRKRTPPSAWDLLHTLVNPSDGSFARAYVNLRAHEQLCFGRPLVVDVPCYNEWAIDSDSSTLGNNTSIRSKRGTTGPIRKPPYIVGHLELQLLYVPRPASATDEDMPKSLGSAVREMAKAEKIVDVEHEGHLSQQGGDCVHWRRRFFRLSGPKLVAYHEHTHQKRAVINLSKATRLVDDKSTLVADPKSGHPGSKSGGRRKSAFAEEDEGYAYVEEGFRIRFANGETIDFYADSTAEKDRWMKALSQVVGKKDPTAGDRKGKWTDLVLRRERASGGRPSTLSMAEAEVTKKDVRRKSGTEVWDFTKPPPSPTKKDAGGSPSKKVKSGGASGGEKARPSTPPMNPRRGHRERGEVKSMIF